jgi:hypothetical protein
VHVSEQQQTASGRAMPRRRCARTSRERAIACVGARASVGVRCGEGTRVRARAKERVRARARARACARRYKSSLSPAADPASSECQVLHAPPPSPGADVAGGSPAPAQMWQKVSPVLVQMWQGRGEPRPRRAARPPLAVASPRISLSRATPDPTHSAQTPARCTCAQQLWFGVRLRVTRALGSAPVTRTRAATGARPAASEWTCIYCRARTAGAAQTQGTLSADAGPSIGRVPAQMWEG